MKIDLICGEAIGKMKKIPDGAIDAVICDPPYGTTACKWDSIIPFGLMWDQLKRITKKNGAIVLFGSQPFASALVMSNPKMFKYEWVWEKNKPSGIATSKIMPMKSHENINVFYQKQTTFNPIKTKTKSISSLYNAIKGYVNKNKSFSNTTKMEGVPVKWSLLINPRTILKFAVVGNRDKNRVHPTQKPVALIEYLIKTYTNEGETVLDFTMGSGTTGVACKNLNRNFIGIESDPTYFAIAEKRIK